MEFDEMKIVMARGQSAVVEEAGRRVVVPLGQANNPEAMERGIPFGTDWAQVIERAGGMHGTPQALADELRRRGIWTAQDLQANVSAAMGAIQAVYGVDLAVLLRAAQEELRHGR